MSRTETIIGIAKITTMTIRVLIHVTRITIKELGKAYKWVMRNTRGLDYD